MKKTTLMFVIGLVSAGSLDCRNNDGGSGTATGTAEGDETTNDNGAAAGSPGASQSDDGGAAGSSAGSTSLGAPAMCSSGDDCPEGVECVIATGGSVGFCAVDETEVAAGSDEASSGGESDGSGGISLGAPAPCATDADCGLSTCNTELGYCEVDEMRIEP